MYKQSNLHKVLFLGIAVVIGFFLLSWLTLGECFILTITLQDHYLLGVGEGTSMYPLIKPGDYLLIDTSPEDLKVGDIIVYYYQGKFVGHRIIGITDEGYITKGDNNPQPDPVVKKSMIIGEIDKIVGNDLSKKIAELYYVRVK
ncbi:signal peptidase I [Archaeoglobales archaeon]|nr:MAG: signal peptidase I [Archaeoglobales archaeon]